MRILADGGLKINRGQQRALVTYLSGTSVKGRVTLVERTGWHEIRGREVFVLPAETIGPRSSRKRHSRGCGDRALRVARKPSRVAVERRRVGARSPLPILAISAALAGPLLHLAEQEGGGLNFFGLSSKGKRRSCSGGERVGSGRVARLRSGVARHGERTGRRVGERDGHRARSRRIGRDRSSRRRNSDLRHREWRWESARGARWFASGTEKLARALALVRRTSRRKQTRRR